MTEQDEKQKMDLLPSLDDFSATSIKRAVRNESLLHPMTLYPTAAGLLSGLAAVLYNTPILFLGMGGLLALGATSSVISYFFRDGAISDKYLKKLTREFSKKRQILLEVLHGDLAQCATIKGAEEYGKQGQEQFVRVEKKYTQLKKLLEKKFNKGELTYGSYLGAAEQVYLSVLDNLLKIVSLMQSIETIDPDYIRARENQLKTLKTVTDADEREFEALSKRLTLRDSQLHQVNSLLTENEESMTVMDETIAAIATLQTGKGLSETDMQTAMAHLKEIASRTTLYK